MDPKGLQSVKRKIRKTKATVSIFWSPPSERAIQVCYSSGTEAKRPLVFGGPPSEAALLPFLPIAAAISTTTTTNSLLFRRCCGILKFGRGPL